MRGFDAYDDALAALRLMEAMREEMTPADRRWLAYRIVFADPDAAMAEGDGLLAEAAWRLYGVDLDGSHASECGGRRLIDWDADAARIAASVRMAYGVPWERFARETGFRDACEMICMLPRETPMGTAIYFRTAEPPRFDGRNGERIAEFKRLKRHYAIEDGGHVDMNGAESDFFAALAKAARNG